MITDSKKIVFLEFELNVNCVNYILHQIDSLLIELEHETGAYTDDVVKLKTMILGLIDLLKVVKEDYDFLINKL